jgi:hypothetical protein
MGRIERKSVNEPDEVRELPAITLNLLRVGSLAVGYATVRPGFRWSTHLRKETDEPLCHIHHLQLLLSGRFVVEMDDGEYVEIGPNEIFDDHPAMMPGWSATSRPSSSTSSATSSSSGDQRARTASSRRF